MIRRQLDEAGRLMLPKACSSEEAGTMQSDLSLETNACLLLQDASRDLETRQALWGTILVRVHCRQHGL